MLSQLTLCKSQFRTNHVSSSVNFYLEAQKVFTVMHIYVYQHAPVYVKSSQNFGLSCAKG